MKVHHETAEAFAARRAAERARAQHDDIVRLAAARTSQAGLKMLLRSRARQSQHMRPYILSEGSQVRVGFLHSPTARQQLKSALVRQISPTYTLEIYRVIGRKLAPHSRRVVLYNLECIDAISEGEQAAAIVGRFKIRLPLELKDVDRRYLMPIVMAAAQTLAHSLPMTKPMFRLSPSRKRAIGDDREHRGLDFYSAVSKPPIQNNDSADDSAFASDGSKHKFLW